MEQIFTSQSNNNIIAVNCAVQTQSMVMKDVCIQTQNQNMFVTPERKKHPVFVCNATAQTVLTVPREERVTRLLLTPEMLTPQMTTVRCSNYRGQYSSTDCSEMARVIGWDHSNNMQHLDVSHKKLNEMYRDILNDNVKQHFTQRQLDAFHLYLFSSDLQYIYKKYASCVQCIGDV